MRIIEPSWNVIIPIDRDAVLEHVEKVARTCYKTEEKITDDSALTFVAALRKKGHHAMLEFGDVTVRFIHNRGFTHEMVRHRLCSFAQESTRYCDYEGELTVIRPYWSYSENEDAYEMWQDHMNSCEYHYAKLRQIGLRPQAARGVLPIDVKTEIVVKANLREWMHIFQLRCAPGAHPDMQRVMKPLRQYFYSQLPEIYGGWGGDDESQQKKAD